MVDDRHTARAPRAALRAESGFSLVELLVASAVSLMVLGGAVFVAKQVQDGYGQQLETASAEQEARFALDWIERLLRQAGSDPYDIRTSPCLPAGLVPSVNGFPPIMRDPNGNGVNDDIRVFADSNILNGLIGGPGPAPGGCTEAGEDVTVAFVGVAGAGNGVIALRDNNQPALGTRPMTDSVVRLLQFQYFDRNRVATTDMARLAWVRATVATQARLRDQRTGQFPVYTVSVDVRLRPRW